MLTFSAMASPTASAACVVDFRLLENPRQPADMQDWTLPLVSDSVMMVLLFELMIETIPACMNVEHSDDPCHLLLEKSAFSDDPALSICQMDPTLPHA